MIERKFCVWGLPEAKVGPAKPAAHFSQRIDRHAYFCLTPGVPKKVWFYMGIMDALEFGVRGALRIGQTAGALAGTGLGWLFGDRPPAPALLRRTFERLGSTYIKLGQFIASSPSLFPADYVEEFQLCLDRAEALPYATIEAIILRELGRPLEKVYESIDPTPLASASIAQVHAATLISGESVVIKVQKPGVRDILLADLNFILVAARILEFLAPDLSRASLSAIVEEIQKTMMEECDFHKEAANMRLFQNFLERTGNTTAVVPRIHAPASTEQVLTMERFYGVPLTDLESIRRFTKNPQATLISAMNTWFASLMLCEIFHADVHAGNLMVLEDGRIGFIDFGIVGRISPRTWEAMAELMEGFALGDAQKTAHAMVTVGVTREDVNIAALVRDLESLFGRMKRLDPNEISRGQVDEDELSRLMLDIVGLGERAGIRFPREFALLLKQFLYFDRYSRILAPELNVYRDSRLIMLATD